MRKEYYEIEPTESTIIENYVLTDTEAEAMIDSGKILVDHGWEGTLFKPVYDEINKTWIEGEPDKIKETAKKSKKLEMKSLCEQKILEGFTSSNGHIYRTNRDDQMNMNGQKDELQEYPDITTVYWKTEDMGYIPHTREEWCQVYLEAFNHKKSTLFKYDSLKIQIDLLEDVEEIKSFKWM